MTSRPYTIDFSLIRQRAKDAALAWVPDEPNAVRVRSSGGTQDRWGDETGETVERVDVAVAVMKRKADSRRTPAGDRTDYDFVAVWGEGELLAAGDLLEHKGRTFEVKRVGAPEVGGESAWWRAELMEVRT